MATSVKINELPKVEKILDTDYLILQRENTTSIADVAHLFGNVIRKDDLSIVAFTGKYDDLRDKPEILTKDVKDLTYYMTKSTTESALDSKVGKEAFSDAMGRIQHNFEHIHGSITELDNTKVNKSLLENAYYTKTQCDETFALKEDLMVEKSERSLIDGQLSDRIDLEVANLSSSKADKSFIDEAVLVPMRDLGIRITNLTSDVNKLESGLIDERNKRALEDGKLSDRIDTKADTIYVNEELDKKADKIDTYTKNEIDTTLLGKSDVGHTHTKSEITDFPTNVSIFDNDAGYLVLSDISGKADKATTLAGYNIDNAYTKSEVDVELAKKADKTDMVDVVKLGMKIKEGHDGWILKVVGTELKLVAPGV